MAESKGKYQPWYHEAFMSDPRVRRMNPLAAKTYMLLLHEAFVCSTRPHLPDDEEDLYLLAFCQDKEEWASVRDTVLGMFQKDVVDGHNVLTNKRLTQDWAHLQEIREARSEAGKASAAKRKSTSVQQMLTNEHKEVSKQVSKEEKLSEVQNEGSDMKLKDELTKIAAQHGAKAGGYKTTWDEIKSLGVAHGTGAVSTDFSAFMEEYHGDDFPVGAVVSYLRVAAERLTASTASAIVVSSDPRVVGLVRELTYLSDGKVTFQGRQKVQLAALLESYPPEELIAVFKGYLETKDLEDPYTLKFLAQNYLDAADGLAYSARRRKQEADDAKAARDVTAERLQREAAEERKLADQKKTEEADVFDPLA